MKSTKERESPSTVEELCAEADSLPTAGGTMRSQRNVRRLREIIDELADRLKGRHDHIETCRREHVSRAFLEAAMRQTEVAERRAERTQHAAALAVAKAERQLNAAVDLTTFDPHGYFVYILWGEDGPIYVGESMNILSRLGSHMGDAEKRHKTRHVTVVRCYTLRQMHRMEERLIRKYRPPMNRKGVPSEAA